MRDKIIKSIPNMLTISRIVASVLGAGVFVAGNIPLATGLYIYGAVSDLFDGLAARKLNAYSELGRKLDALSDKLYAGSLLIPSILCGNLLMLIPLMLELKISHINLKSEKLGFKPETLRIGKFKTALLFPSMIVGLLSTISIGMYPLLWLLLSLTTILQSKSIIAYENLLNYNIKNKDLDKQKKDFLELDCDKSNNNNIKDNAHKNVTTKVKSHNDSMNLVEELAFYIMTPYFKEDNKNNDTKSIYKSYTKTKRRVK